MLHRTGPSVHVSPAHYILWVSDHPIIDPTVRRAYAATRLADDVAGAPLPLLRQWWAQAVGDERIAEPDAMVVATVDEAGHPDARTVLLKQLSPAGFTFFTNTDSAKGRQLRHTPYAALVLPWHPMHRQVRARGPVTEVPREEAAAYFATRPRDSQVASAASQQSRPVGSRVELERAVAAEQARWPDTGSPTDVPLPPSWGGFRVQPDQVELWAGQPSRLHDRILFTRAGAADLDDASAWTVTRLQP